MDSSDLIATGLQPQQAEAYALLIKTGGIAPAEAARELKLSRTNAYKLFDRLVELGLADKVDSKKKIAYQPSNPLALSQMVGDARNRVTSQEEAVHKIMSQLLEQYYKQTEQPNVHVVTGRDAVYDAYMRQVNLRQDVHFIRSRADMASMGFDTMHDIRTQPARFGQQRFGITPDPLRGTVNPEGDKRSNLARTWVRQEDYSAPVEWSVSGDILLIVLFGSEPHAITVTSPIIADAFRQLWHLLDVCLQAMPYYQELPRATSKKA